eukprot:scaffold160217_cov30-Tisochrysis_lutea.AAC.5
MSSHAIRQRPFLFLPRGCFWGRGLKINKAASLHRHEAAGHNVDYVEESGKLYYFSYPLADGSGSIPVATTRPETILGDTAVCVHPEDERFSQYVGKEVRVPGTERTCTVIADDYVQMDFGTGALKVTPAHDINDYEIGKRHSLPLINILNKDATMNSNAGKYEGLDRCLLSSPLCDRYECRAKLWADLEEEGLTRKVEDHQQRVPRSQRSGEVSPPPTTPSSSPLATWH